MALNASNSSNLEQLALKALKARTEAFDGCHVMSLCLLSAVHWTCSFLYDQLCT